MVASAAPFAVGWLASTRLVAAGAAFYGVFGVFVVAFFVLAFLSVRWAVRRDRVGRAAWAARRQAAQQAAPRGGAPSESGPLPGGPGTGTGPGEPVSPPRTNGHRPRQPGRRGRERNQPG